MLADMTSAAQSRPRVSKTELAVIAALFWGSVLVDAAEQALAPELGGGVPSWPHFLIKRGALAVLWTFVAAALMTYYRRRPADFESRARAARTLLVALAFSTLISATFSAVTAGLLTLLRPLALAEALRRMWPGMIVYEFFTAWQVIVAVHAYLSYRQVTAKKRESAELALRLRGAELALLRSQLEPHFLFNTLNSIASLVRLDRKQEATDALHRLAALLRGVLDAGAQQLMPWRWEREFSSMYVELQQLRFAELLTVELDDEGVSAHREVPLLLLQPLLENAIQHGALADGARCHISVRARQAEARLHVAVENPRGREARPGSGMGLVNLRSRLRALYGEAFELSYGPKGERFVVRIALPERDLDEEPARS